MKRIKAVFGLAFSLSLLTASPVMSEEAEEAKKTDEEQKIILPEQTEVELTAAGGDFFQFAGMGMFAASAGDLVTTEWGLRQEGIYEGNPISSNRGVRIASHVVAPAVVWWATEKMQKKGQQKLALLLRIGLMVTYSYATVHNMHTINRP